jgi:hypothetical protein
MVVSEPSVEISFDHRYELVGCLMLRRECLLAFDEDMKSQMALNQFCHQSIQCAATGGDELQDFFALLLPIERPLNRLDLALDATDARKRLCLVFRRM